MMILIFFVVPERNAGESLVGGLAEGVTGLFTAPAAGARKEGFAGFAKGVGKGLVGLAVKPVVGVGEAAVSVVQTASNATDASKVTDEPSAPCSALHFQGSRSLSLSFSLFRMCVCMHVFMGMFGGKGLMGFWPFHCCFFCCCCCPQAHCQARARRAIPMFPGTRRMVLQPYDENAARAQLLITK